MDLVYNYIYLYMKNFLLCDYPIILLCIGPYILNSIYYKNVYAYFS